MLVGNGLIQRSGIDFIEDHALLSKHETIRIVA